MLIYDLINVYCLKMLLFKRIVTLLIFRCTDAFFTCGTRVLITSKDIYVCVKPKFYVFIKINIIISLYVLMLLNFSIVLFLYLFKMNLIENCMIETLKRIKDLCNIYCQKIIVILYFMAVKLYLLFLP